MVLDQRDNAWRQFQSDFLKRQKKRRLCGLAVKTLLVMSLCLVSVWGYSRLGSGSLSPLSTDTGSLPGKDQAAPSQPVAVLSTQTLQTLLSPVLFLNAGTNIFFADDQDRRLKITTSLDIDLQEFLAARLQRLENITRGKPRNISFVIMEPVSGKIIGLAGYDLDNPGNNPCYDARFPAASIFKIITAAAAVETLGYTPDTPLYFNGNKYTLYKRQLTEKQNKYSNKISLGQAFAESINPVFGKIGQNHMDREILSAYARAFGFNDSIVTEIIFNPGRFVITDDPYHWAEIGCGFNTDTTISPIFGAMLVSTILNEGKVPVPAIVEQVTDDNGNLVYQWEKIIYNTAIQSKTANIVAAMMEKTVSAGTAKKSFKGMSRHPVLSKLAIGGKTGSLYNKDHTIKYDWFTGFGTQKDSNRQIALAVVVGHGKYYGTRASEYGKMILAHYFKDTGTSDVARN